jgi:hypothetical protein
MAYRRAIRAATRIASGGTLPRRGGGGGGGGAAIAGPGYGAMTERQAVAVPVRNTAALAVPPQREQALGEPQRLSRGGANFHRMVGIAERGFSIRQ